MEANCSKSSLSAGELIRAVLTGSEAGSIATKIFPVMTDNATLPYVSYRRIALVHSPVKGLRGPDKVSIEIGCFAASYPASLELAEAVRDALDGRQAEHEGLVMRSCVLTDSSEEWQDDAFIQTLIFEIGL